MAFYVYGSHQIKELIYSQSKAFKIVLYILWKHICFLSKRPPMKPQSCLSQARGWMFPGARPGLMSCMGSFSWHLSSYMLSLMTGCGICFFLASTSYFETVLDLPAQKVDVGQSDRTFKISRLTNPHSNPFFHFSVDSYEEFYSGNNTETTGFS